MVDPGRSVAFNPAWTIPERPWNIEEGLPTQQQPHDSELDYAILRLAERVGDQPVGDLAKAARGAPPRGWLDMSVDFARHKIAVNTPVTVIQHPKPPGIPPLPLSASLGVLIDTPWPIRVRYNSVTDGGSSGSPCFNSSMDLIAIHHAADVSTPSTFNQGVPMKAIMKDWKSREQDFISQGASPPWKTKPNFVAPTPNLQLLEPSPERALVLDVGGAI
jgi:hypothetical protein